VSCKFCEIATRRLPAHVVLESGAALGFLDHRPLFPGHTLVVPKVHHDTLMDLPADLLTELFADVQLLARAMEDSLGAQGSFVAVNNRVSQSVPHVHVHVVPRRPKDGLRGFFWPRQRYRDEQHAVETAAALRSALDEIRG
jgi:histidine triad (HIT) family protein